MVDEKAIEGLIEADGGVDLVGEVVAIGGYAEAGLRVHRHGKIMQCVGPTVDDGLVHDAVVTLSLIHIRCV